MSGAIGSTGAWLLTLLLMAAIVVVVGATVIQVDEPQAAAASHQTDGGPSGDGLAGGALPGGGPPGQSAALAQAPEPTAVPDTPAAIPTATATAVPTATPTATPTVPPTPTATLPPPTPTPTEAPLEAPAVPTATATPLPMPTPNGVYSWTLEVPILMYHYISQPPAGADKYRLDLSTPPELFREQMTYLVANGYETVSLYDLTLAIVNQAQLPARPVVLTFDDGYRDNYENAFPVLRELGLTGTFFVATEFVDENQPEYMDWAMIEEMAAAGMRIEPHSKTHPDLSVQDRAFILWEVLGSQETIASHIGYTPRYFAYPSGRYNDEVLQIVDELDFWGAVTTANGNWHSFGDRFEWGRVRMRDTTSLEELAALIG
jgi:peptidoglycan/xylan/chitin deacetylase (PgdA/CDA1 family)